MRGARAAVIAVLFAAAPGTVLRARGVEPTSGGSQFAPEAVKIAVATHIQRLEREGDGRIALLHPGTGEELHLVFEDVGIVSAESLWRIHDPRRTYEGRGYFACTTFHDAGGGAQGRRFDVDYLLVDSGGRLEVAETLVHREGHLANGAWVWQTVATKEKIGPAGQ